MTGLQRAMAIQNLLCTSVDDCKSSLDHYTDTNLLCDLLIECHKRGHTSREKVVRRRIAQLTKGGRYGGVR